MSSRRVLIGSAAALAAAAGVGVGWWSRSRTAPAPAAATAAAVPDGAAASESVEGPWALRFERPQGGELDFAAFRGKPLVLNFWATWCAPCVREMPLFDRFAKENAAKGWQVVGIAIDRTDAVKTYLERVKVGFPIAVAGFAGSDLSRQYGNAQGGLPFTVVFDAAGRLVERQLGETHYEMMLAWVAKHG